MAWYSYDRGYGGGRARRYGGQSYDRDRYGGFSAGYGAPRTYRAYGSGYDGGFARRRAPERSPTYGRFGDRAARGYARRHGYDAGYAFEPGRFGRGYAARGGYGMMDHRGWTEGSYDWSYRR